MIEAERLSFRYTHQDQPIDALRDLSLAVPEGQLLALVGPSGCGKTTFLRCCAGLLRPGEGAIDGHLNVGGLSPSAARAKRLLGVVFQTPALLPWRTVQENIALPLELSRANRVSTSTITDILQAVGLDGFATFLPHRLSEGMKHRVSLARALIASPQVLLLDEPFSRLDEITRDRLYSVLSQVRHARPFTGILVTHSIYEALSVADSVAVLSARPGRVVERLPSIGSLSGDQRESLARRIRVMLGASNA